MEVNVYCLFRAEREEGGCIDVCGRVEAETKERLQLAVFLFSPWSTTSIHGFVNPSLDRPIHDFASLGQGKLLREGREQ